MFSYRSILKKAWSIVFKNPYLWFFGLFASFLSIGAEYRILTEPLSPKNSVDWYYRLGGLSGNGMWGANTWHMIINNPGRAFLVILIFLLTLAVTLFVLWLAVSSQLALVKNTEKIIKSKKEKDEDSFHFNLKAGSVKFWPALMFNVLSRIIISILVLIVALPMLFPLRGSIVLNVIYVLLFLLFIPAAISISLMMKYAISFLVLKNKKFFVALEESWKLFKNNWLISLEMGLILFGVSFIATLAIVVGVMILSIPFVILGAAFLQLLPFVVFWAVTVLGLIVLTLFIVICGSILSAYQIIAWTDLFMRLTTKSGGESKLERIVSPK